MPPSLTLYDFELSADCYKARLMLALLGLAHVSVPIDVYPGREHEANAYRRISAAGRVPALADGDRVVDEPTAILRHLAETRDPSGRWYPRDPLRRAETDRWLAVAESLGASAGAARLHENFFVPADAAALRAAAHREFRRLDEHLWFAERAGDDWLVPGADATIADVACLPDVLLSEEGGIGRIDYPAVRRWTDRVRRLPGFVPMSGVFPAAPARTDAAVRPPDVR
ncbi:glutathione S-transferase family protein [Methylobrevis albus]|uniref:Glutathione S-transferase family protein n=1 Tax=Methylobrevis albus TaxID=2793297 RepID=A0A931MZ75_9HYPH|nr:glutathione S-transferase family protein [Methylobrevis albus]MBH0238750.1 glutathione S-transferase family protein [Methylobrevis albus]